jgi:hypothetical protein
VAAGTLYVLAYLWRPDAERVSGRLWLEYIVSRGWNGSHRYCDRNSRAKAPSGSPLFQGAAQWQQEGAAPISRWVAW